MLQNIGALGIILGIFARFWPVWLALAVLLSLSLVFRRRLEDHVPAAYLTKLGMTVPSGSVTSAYISRPR